MAPLSLNTPWLCRRCAQALSERSTASRLLPLRQTRSLRSRPSSRSVTKRTSPPTEPFVKPLPSIGDDFPETNSSASRHNTRSIRPTRKTRHTPFEAESEPERPKSSLDKPITSTLSQSVPSSHSVKKTNASIAQPSIQDPWEWNWHWETFPPSATQLEYADHFFTKEADPRFLIASSKFRQIPEGSLPEVAFVGRSNVGKSSLLNAIVNRPLKTLAAVSAKPGRTRSINLYGVGPPTDGGVRIKEGSGDGHTHPKIIGRGGLVITDLPGHGSGSLKEWGTEIMKYLTQRKQLRRTFVLINALHGLKETDRQFLTLLRGSGVSHQIILAQMDRVYIPHSTSTSTHSTTPIRGLANLRAQMEKVRAEIQPKGTGAAVGEILACSAEKSVAGKRLGIDAVRHAVLQAAGIGRRVQAPVIQGQETTGVKEATSQERPNQDHHQL